MSVGSEKAIHEVFRLLSEQRQLLTHWPYTKHHVEKEREISNRVRELIDRNCFKPASLDRKQTRLD